MLLFLAWLTISNDTSPHPRSFDMADQELATLIAKIENAEARRDKLEVGVGGVVDRDMLFVAQQELTILQTRLNNLMEKQGEKLAFRSPRCIVSCRPMHASESPKGASHKLLETSKGTTS